MNRTEWEIYRINIMFITVSPSFTWHIKDSKQTVVKWEFYGINIMFLSVFASYSWYIQDLNTTERNRMGNLWKNKMYKSVSPSYTCYIKDSKRNGAEGEFYWINIMFMSVSPLHSWYLKDLNGMERCWTGNLWNRTWWNGKSEV